MKRALGCFGAAAGVVATELLLLTVSVGAIYRVFEARRTAHIAGALPDLFPIVVIFPDPATAGHRASVVWQRDLVAFLAAHPVHSFRIPQDEVPTLRAQVEGSTRANGAQRSPFWFATFKVGTRADGVQEVEVVGTGDDDYENRSWYEVRGDAMVALRHLHYFGPGVAIVWSVPLFVGTTVLNLALWYGGWWLYRFRKVRRHSARA